MVVTLVVSVFQFSSIGIAMAGAGGKMIKIPGATFKMGAEKKAVTVKGFSIDKYEVTNDAFKKFDKSYTSSEGKAQHPAVEMTYFEAEKYCKSVGKRLPTGAEWELAARGTDGRIYPWGNEFDSSKANTVESEKGDTTPVGSYKNGVSPYGVADMCGNVWEWVDQYLSSEKQYKLAKGGSFFDNQRNGKVYSVIQSIPDDMHTYVGFRCAK